MTAWETNLHQYMIETEKDYCLSAAIGGYDFANRGVVEPGLTWWGAASTAGPGSEEAWAAQFAEDQERPILQEDGSEKQVHICEFETVVQGALCDLKADGPPKNGVWIGGNKHSIVRKEINSSEEQNFLVITTARKGETGYVIVCTDPEVKGKSVILTAEYDKQRGCQAPMATGVALSFAKWCKDNNVDEF